MKWKVIALILVLSLLMLPMSAAAQKPNDKAGKGALQGGSVSGPPVENGPNKSVGKPVAVIAKQQDRLNRTLKERITLKKQEQEREMKNLTLLQQQIHRNQNVVRLAVHTFLALENRSGGIGQNISALAKGFNNSVQATIRAEEQIHSRNAFYRLIVGGDGDAAAVLQMEVNASRLRIAEMNRIVNASDCTEQDKVILREQLRNMEQEMTRLEVLALEELNTKGLFSWFAK